MKKNWWLFLILAVLLLLGGSFAVKKVKKSQEGPTPTPTPEGVLIETILEERPYVTLTPRADGREITLSISQIENAQTIEYELVYLSAGLSRGVIGSIDVNGETTISRKLLLGTCSRNVCKYDENVTEGTLTLRFRSSEGVRKFVSDFHLQRGDKILTSMDENFKIEGQIPAGTYYLTMSTIGLPEEIGGTPVSEIYGVFTPGNTALKNAQLTLGLSGPSANASLYLWQGRTWKEEKTGFETDSKTVSATINQFATFVVTTPK